LGSTEPSPTTRDAEASPSEDTAEALGGIAAAAIFVMLIDDVLDARIVSGRSSFAKEANSCCFRLKFSDTA
jgi:hypothetical protein